MAGQRADGTAGRLPLPVEELFPGRSDPHRQQDHQSARASAAPTTIGCHRTYPRAIELLEQLHDDPRDGVLSPGSLSGSATVVRASVNSQPEGASGCPDLRRTGDTAYARGGRCVGDGLSARRCPRGKTAPQAYRCGDHGAVRGSTGGAQPSCWPRSTNTRPTTTSGRARRVRQLSARHPARRPGARSLTNSSPPSTPTQTPHSRRRRRVQRNDRDILTCSPNARRHCALGPANYCWFTDPSRALCLKLAGTPTADRPMIGMCDSARCPQATHHQHHRPVWVEHAERTKTFLGQLGRTRTTERARLDADYRPRFSGSSPTSTSHPTPGARAG